MQLFEGWGVRRIWSVNAKSEIGLGEGFGKVPGPRKKFFHVVGIGASSKNAI